MSYTILVVDDIKSTVSCLVDLLTENGWQSVAAYSGAEAYTAFSQRPFNLAIIDMRMPGMDGITLLKKIRETDKLIPVIMMSAFHSIESVSHAISLDIFDILQKPFTVPEAIAMIKRALAYGVALQGAIDLNLVATPCNKWMNLVAESESMRNVCFAAAQVAPTSASILIVGERGSGRTALARAIHAFSTRRSNPFIVIDASKSDTPSIPEKISNLSAEERAGTLYLRHVNSLSRSQQEELTAVLKSKELENSDAMPSLPRFIASFDIAEQDNSKELLPCLANFIAQMKIDVPPLRDRPSDILPLAYHFLGSICPASSPVPVLDIEVATILERYSWPGNTSEMESIFQEVIKKTNCIPEQISANILPDYIVKKTGAVARPNLEELKAEFLQALKLREFLFSASKEEIQHISELLRTKGIGHKFSRPHNGGHIA